MKVVLFQESTFHGKAGYEECNFEERNKMIDREKVYRDISSFIYKYTHDSALTYPKPEDYVQMSEDMGFAKISLRLDFPEGMFASANNIVRIIYDSEREPGEEITFRYTVAMGGVVEVVYYLDRETELSEEDRRLYQWVCDQIFLVYGKQQVVDALNLVSKVSR